jgi:hypothetical protein
MWTLIFNLSVLACTVRCVCAVTGATAPVLQVRSGEHDAGPAGFEVRLINRETKVEMTTVTGRDGSYSFAGVLPGTYRIVQGTGGGGLCAARTEAGVVVRDAGVRVADDLLISGYALSVCAVFI